MADFGRQSAMYTEVNNVIKFKGTLSASFKSYTGVKQGLRRRSNVLITIGFVACVLYLYIYKIKPHATNSQLNQVHRKPQKTVYSKTNKPERCVHSGMRPHCLKGNLTGINQCTTEPKCSCFPHEIFLQPFDPIDGGTFPEKDEEVVPLEQEVFYDEELTDYKLTADASKSLIRMDPLVKTYKVGDIIKIRIDLIDGRGIAKQVGGDDVIAWITSVDKQYKASGEVTDLKNGSYIATFEALWGGETVVLSALPYTREAIASNFRWQRQYRTFNYYAGHFINGNTKEFVLCSMFSVIPGYTKICNLTEVNYGYPWYCGYPLKPNLTCRDFKFAKDFEYIFLQLTDAQYNMFIRNDRKILIGKELKFTINKGAPTPNHVNCNKLSPRETWNTTMPTGYFKGGRWKPLKCNNPVNSTNFLECFRNSTLIVCGDSTVRQYYAYIQKSYKCEQMTGKWTKKKWYGLSKCFIKHYNFTLMWAPQELPFEEGYKTETGRTNLEPPSVLLDGIPSTGRVIFVIHYYSHFIRQHYTFFRHRIRSLKPAIRNALKRNSNIQIAIKSPHVFYYSYCAAQFSIFHGKLYIEILKKELKDFQDKVWFLNFWDMSTASENRDIHPPSEYVWENLRLLAGYVCKNRKK